ncbi:hypothetical protein MTR67_000984 [Solanum verrucosum]|uniref:Uncharacterized protein n=1 Tax=Solanum verrucosum TaxID=315347 RepID=A0AAF0T7G2_SOLVR|nr:hypothetical protein MTR67_000984 [Solanum verrucosum]
MALDIPQQHAFNDWNIRNNGRFDFSLLKLYNIRHFEVNDELIIRYPFSIIHHGNRKVLRRRHLIEAKGSISTNAPGSR